MKLAVAGVLGLGLSGCVCNFDWDGDRASIAPPHRMALHHAHLLAAKPRDKARAGEAARPHAEDERRRLEACAGIKVLWKAHKSLTVTDQRFNDENCPQIDGKAFSQ